MSYYNLPSKPLSKAPPGGEGVHLKKQKTKNFFFVALRAVRDDQQRF